MGRMTGHAIACFDGFTQIFVFRILDRPLLQFDRVGMTLPADDRLGIFQQLFLFGPVGIMAVQTPLFISQRSVQAILAEGFPIMSL